MQWGCCFVHSVLDYLATESWYYCDKIKTRLLVNIAISQSCNSMCYHDFPVILIVKCPRLYQFDAFWKKKISRQGGWPLELVLLFFASFFPELSVSSLKLLTYKCSLHINFYTLVCNILHNLLQPENLSFQKMQEKVESLRQEAADMQILQEHQRDQITVLKQVSSTPLLANRKEKIGHELDQCCKCHIALLFF